MSIDCHYHLDTRIQSFDNLIQKMDANQIEKTALMPYLCDPLPHTPEFLLKLLRFFLTHRSLRGLAKKLAANFTAEGDIELPKGIVKIYADPDNAPVAQGIEMHPDRFLGWMFVNPRGEKNPLDSTAIVKTEER